MIKELFLAIILGATLGFGATGAYFALNKTKNPPPVKSEINLQNLNSNNSSDPESANSLPDSAISTSNHQLSIDSPENESIVTNSKITLKGSTTPESLLVIRTPTNTYHLASSQNGTFEKDIEIESGVNLIYISSFSPDDVQTDSEITVTYSTAKI